MLEAKWDIDTEQGKGWEYSGKGPSLFFDQKTNRLEEKLEKFLTTGKRYNGEIYEFTLRQGFLPKHTNEILYNWQTTNRIDVLLANGEKARKGAFYIAYNYFRDEHKKASFKLK